MKVADWTFTTAGVLTMTAVCGWMAVQGARIALWLAVSYPGWVTLYLLPIGPLLGILAGLGLCALLMRRLF